MSLSIWSYLQNPFDNVTKKSNKHMILMATDHFDKLYVRRNEANINELYLFGKKAFEEFVALYSKSSTDLAIYQMRTERLVLLIEELSSTLARRWDILIQVKFDIVTADYKSLMPNGRSLFQSGAYDMRIIEVKNLANRLRSFPEFESLRNEILEFHEKLVNVRTDQQGIESVIQMNSKNLEIARVELAQVMHCIFGSLLRIYYKSTNMVETFYDLKYLRKTIKEKETDVVISEDVDVPENKTVAVLDGKISDNNDLRIVNTGETTLIAHTAPNRQSIPTPDSGYIVYSGQIVTLKSKKNDTVLLITNDNETLAGKVYVEKLE